MPRAILIVMLLTACAGTIVTGVISLGGLDVTVYPAVDVKFGGGR